MFVTLAPEAKKNSAWASGAPAEGRRVAAWLGRWRINALYHEASGDNYLPSKVFFDLESGVIDAVRASPLG
jgi:hypothetical protein